VASGEWQTVTEESPCDICDKSTWCSVSLDGKKAICRRKDNGAGVHKVDSSGADYWLYELNGHGGERRVLGVDATKVLENPEKADLDTLNKCYRALLEGLALSHDDRQDLRRRDLSQEEIEHRGYRTLSASGREDLARNL
jgi:hypothetical protein